MREIKFRAWDSEVKCFVASYTLVDNELLPNRSGIIISQFTGLKDKNGKEIYEGDVVKFALYDGEEDKIKEVEYMENYFSPMLLPRLKVEVIGNIFENPELIK